MARIASGLPGQAPATISHLERAHRGGRPITHNVPDVRAGARSPPVRNRPSNGAPAAQLRFAQIPPICPTPRHRTAVSIALLKPRYARIGVDDPALYDSAGDQPRQIVTRRARIPRGTAPARRAAVHFGRIDPREAHPPDPPTPQRVPIHRDRGRAEQGQAHSLMPRLPFTRAIAHSAERSPRAASYFSVFPAFR